MIAFRSIPSTSDLFDSFSKFSDVLGSGAVEEDEEGTKSGPKSATFNNSSTSVALKLLLSVYKQAL